MITLNKISGLISAGLLILLAPALPAQTDNCYNCHAEWEDAADAPSQLYKADDHFNAGLGCSDCHGGDPTLEDMEDVRKSKGYKGIPTAKEIPQFCSSCHSDPSYMVKHNPSLPTDQYAKYQTSVHGKKLLKEGDTKVANCVSCHSVHNIASAQLPASSVYALNLPQTCARCHADPEYMAEYNIPTNQFDEYSQSIHGQALLIKKDINAPACNDCHGNHGATPPGITSISDVCGVCHALIADEFSHSPHKTAFDDAGFPECEICHSNHLIKKMELYMVGVSDSSLCIQCHSPGDGTLGLKTAEEINANLTKLHTSYNLADSITNDAEMKGLLVTDLRFALQEIKQIIIKSRTLVHSFDAGKVSDITKQGTGKADSVYQSGLLKIDDYYFRRKGLGIATIIITILAITLYLKIKSIEK